MRNGLTVVLMLIVTIYLQGAIEAHAEEPVAKLRRSYKEVGNQYFCETEAECSSLVFNVYTVPEINAMRDDLEDQMDSLTRQGGIVDQKINSAERRLMNRINSVLNAKDNELVQIKQTMQKQIDDLKSELENLKRTK